MSADFDANSISYFWQTFANEQIHARQIEQLDENVYIELTKANEKQQINEKVE